MSFKNKFKTPIDQLKHWAQVKPDAVYLTQPINNQVIEFTWFEVLDQVSKVSEYLRRYPVGSHIAIMSLNCAHWVMADLAIQMAGHISIPIYPTAAVDTVGKILRHSECKAIFLGKMFEVDEAVQLLDAAIKGQDLPHQKIDKLSIYQAYKGMPFWQQLVDTNQPSETSTEHLPSELVSIIYTSGTTGDPKGVMISYAAINASMELIKNVIVLNEQDRFVSYLPLAHVAERMAVEFGALYNGAHVSFIRSIDTFTEDVKAAAPTIFFGVPRIWTKIKLAIEAKLGGASVLDKLLRLPLLGQWLKRSLLKKLGFNDVRFALCAAAAVNKDVLQWYDQLGLKLNEAYGMSETCGLSHMTKQCDTKTGSVGRVIDGCECKLSASGEVLIRNPAMMSGYFKQAELTAQTIDHEGWLHTGDLGEVDAEGFLYITGRVKDLFKTSKGKYIVPSPIEQRFQSALGIEHVILMGDGLAQSFLLVSTFDTRFEDDPGELITLCQQQLNHINLKLETHEQLSHVFISNQAWTTENGLLTPTLKIIRNAIENTYQSQAQRLIENSNQKVSVLK